MKNKYVFVTVMLCVILVVGMGVTNLYMRYQEQGQDDGTVTVVTSFYPMYIAAMNIIGDTDGVSLESLSEPQTGCLHDFQLTPEDMKRLSGADIFIINGGGIESFMETVAQSYPELRIVEACGEIALISDEEDAHEHEHGEDTHIHSHDENAHAWMSVPLYRQMVRTIAGQLGDADPVHRDGYQRNADAYDKKLAALQQRQQAVADAASGTQIILFHEAYAYVAADYGMNVCYVMDLDEERQISAGEVADVLAEIQKNHVPLILAESLYGTDMAETVAQETDVSVVYLNPLNRGDYDADSYLKGMEHNIALLEAYFIS